MPRLLNLLLIAFILIGATALFMQGMADAPLWFDEAYSMDVARTPDIWQRIQDNRIGTHPPLFYFLQRLNPWLSGQVFTPRVVSLFASVLGVALAYRLARDLFSVRAGVAAAVLVATSDLVISMSPLIRHYSLFMTLSILVTWFYWRFQEGRGWRWGAAYVLGGLALLYTMYWGGFILIAHGIHTLISYPRRLPRMLLVAAVISAAYAPWLPYMLHRAGNFESGYHSAVNLDWQGLNILRFHLFGLPENFLIVLTAAGAAGTLFARRLRDYLPDKRTLLLLLWLVVPLLLPALSDVLFDYKLLNHRSMIGMVPAVAILIGHLLGQLDRRLFVVLLAALLVNNLTTSGSGPPPRGPWWQIGDALAGCTAPDDILVIDTRDILQWVTLQQHAELAGIPHDSIYWVNQIPESVNAMQSAAQETDHVCWLRYLDSNTPDSSSLGAAFIATSPPLTIAEPGQNGVLLDFVQIGHYHRLVEADDPQAQFDDLFKMLDLETYQRDGQIYVHSLWQALDDPAGDYTFSAFLTDQSGALVAQRDSPPLDGANPTSAWTGGSLYADIRSMDVSNLASGQYRLGFQVYDAEINNLPVTPCDGENCPRILLEAITVP